MNYYLEFEKSFKEFLDFIKTHRKFACFVLMVKLLEEINAQTVECELFKSADWSNVGHVKTCFMNKTTSISSRDVEIASERDFDVKQLNFRTNKKIFFLPVFPSEKFPNLMIYNAAECLIHEISRQNFRGLYSLEHLWLEKNQIRKIESDTFINLVAVKQIGLG